MKEKVAIIDALGAHGSSHHFYLFGQLKGLKRNGVDVRLYTNSKTEDPRIDGVGFYQSFGNLFSSEIKVVRGLKYILGSVVSALHARFNGVGVFHFHVFHINLLMLFNIIFVKLMLGKAVLTIHDVTSFTSMRYSSILRKLSYKLSNLILTHNKFSKEEIIKIAPFVKDNIFIVHHGNYTPFINIRKDRIQSRVHLNLPKDKTILLFFGMIKKEKGLEILLHSFRQIVDTNPNVFLLIAGKPWKNNFGNYQKIINKHNLAKNIILHIKFIPNEDVEYYYCASDLVVLPYKKIYQSGVLMMALSYGKPVLASDLAPLKEVIIDNETGFLFKSGDVNDLVKKVNIIFSDKENIERVRKNGNKLINKKFSWDMIGRLIKKAYQTL